jgi:hypothetical protein
VLGAAALLVVVLGTATLLLVAAPVTGIGLGTLVGLDGNAVFAPIDPALDRLPADPAAPVPPPAPGDPPRWLEAAGVTAFLAGLVALFPHLAHAEEVAFRTGWEALGLGRRVSSALRFGLVHLVMLIPLAAALAIAVAGFAYGQVYRRAYRRAAVPTTVLRPSAPRLVDGPDGVARLVLGPPVAVEVTDVRAARDAAALEAAVWHTTANTLVALLVWGGYLTTL